MTFNTHPPIHTLSTCVTTNHADKRMQQRGITEEMIRWAIQIGTVFQKQGMDMVVVRKKDVPQNMGCQAAEKLAGVIILIKEGTIVTSYKRGDCAVRHFKKKNKKNMKKRKHLAA